MKTINFITFISALVLLGGCSFNEVETSATGLGKGSSKQYEPLMIAHRGASEIEPEHTLLSYERAIKDKADYIEIDLRQTKDGHLVANHDKTVDRTTNGKGEVEDLTLDQIKKLRTEKGQKILTIEEIIKKFGQTTNYYIETRTNNKGKLVMEKKLIDILSKNKLIANNKVVLESFSDKSLKKLHKLNSHVPLVQLLKDEDVKNMSNSKLKEIKKYSNVVGPNAKLVDKDFVEKVHNNHMKVHVFFDTDKERTFTSKMLKLKVDGLFTNNPAYTEKVLKEDYK
ncbi:MULTISPECIES: glycerophosphodiester phosphodiesterase family protein [Bacillus amyloliquefaciens group]|uniref:glycerophosphodiester phosphodiesterase family protein n=1 Tax=Bacillus TaxID=1386 RepID=UPI00020596F5|nr:MULTISPECIES: glycerophosphodiester phosphodiesterase family protein [Bacillus amyloliquefaciens group]AIW34142.1 glycerophosphodiester phosphodiesterase [Bacillus subtilis]AEB23397.1 glycerophosphoryl diester phosphodiesterase [Bacillus amyloliquefaciens TA208]AEK88408.1 glycerophosphoryl diester phosphodiesterase [Bacillus amyloliquefaciens XH7]KYC94822.1 Glycerophosphoryl diester phosphodiesterase [Bacillus amyloliquefaciens]MBW8280067.1 glycerophosphodiester phosphodiesterase [Bacillus 